jgi:RNA polymerase sigma-70 factor (sigma-E family)
MYSDRRGGAVAESFENYVIARGQSLLRFAYVLSGDHHLAEDLVQEVLARIHARWRRLDRADNPDAYIRRAIVREFLSWRRRRSSSEQAMPVPPEPSPAATTDPLADRDEVRGWLAELTRAQRAVLVLRFYEDLADEQIAEILGCSKATVRVHASRGLARLRVGVHR